MIKTFAIAAAVVFAIAALAAPTEATVSKYRSEGWHEVEMDQRRAVVTLVDRTPAKTYVWVAWQKKAGPTKCRARVTFTKGDYSASQVFEKYGRKRSKSGVWYLAHGGRTDKTIKTTIKTNGRCIVWAAVK